MLTVLDLAFTSLCFAFRFHSPQRHHYSSLHPYNRLLSLCSVSSLHLLRQRVARRWRWMRQTTREWAAHCPGAQATYGKCGYVDFLKLCWERERQCDLTVAFTFAAHVVVTVDFRPCRPCVFCFSLWAIRVGPALHDCCLFFLFRSFFLFPCNSSLLWLSSHIFFRVLNFYLFWAKHTIFCFVFLLMAYAPLSLDVFVLLSGQFAEAVIAL